VPNTLHNVKTVGQEVDISLTHTHTHTHTSQMTHSLCLWFHKPRTAKFHLQLESSSKSQAKIYYSCPAILLFRLGFHFDFWVTYLEKKFGIHDAHQTGKKKNIKIIKISRNILSCLTSSWFRATDFNAFFIICSTIIKIYGLSREHKSRAQGYHGNQILYVGV
jgi:hypothetical protein